MVVSLRTIWLWLWEPSSADGISLVPLSLCGLPPALLCCSRATDWHPFCTLQVNIFNDSLLFYID